METDALRLIVAFSALTAIGFVFRAAMRRLGVPPVVSLMALGMALGGLLPEVWLSHRPSLSHAAFVLLLLRAGLMVSTETVRRVLVPAIAFGTIPVLAEILAVLGLSRLLLFDHFGICLLAAFIVAAISPAVILPIMIDQREQNRGAARMIPERIIGMTIVNAFVAQAGILVTLSMLDPETTVRTEVVRLMLLPLAVAGGLLLGSAIAWLTRIEWLLSSQWLLSSRGSPGRAVSGLSALLALIAALTVYFLSQRIGTESVLATLALGVALRRRIEPWVDSVGDELKRIWSVAEIILFVNVGSYVDFTLLWSGPVVLWALVIVVGALLVRIGVAKLLVDRTILTSGERSYTVLAQIPKATIQAVFGAMPLAVFTSRGQYEFVPDGQVIVILAAVAIVATAPLGAVTLERRAEQLL